MPEKLFPPPFPLDLLSKRATPDTFMKGHRLSMNPRLEWTFSTGAKDAVRAEMTSPAPNRAPFKVWVKWDGRSLRTGCTCPVRKGRYCSHRVALALALRGHLLHLERNGGRDPDNQDTSRQRTDKPRARKARGQTAARSDGDPAPRRFDKTLRVTYHLVCVTGRRSHERALAVAIICSWSEGGQLRSGSIDCEDVLDLAPELPSTTRTELKKIARFAEVNAKDHVGLPAMRSFRLVPCSQLDRILPRFREGSLERDASSPIRVGTGRLELKLESRHGDHGSIYLRAFLAADGVRLQRQEAHFLCDTNSSWVLVDDAIYETKNPFHPWLWRQMSGQGYSIYTASVGAFAKKWRSLLEPLGVFSETPAAGLRIITSVRPAPVLRLEVDTFRLLATLQFEYGNGVPLIPSAEATSMSCVSEGDLDAIVVRDRYWESQYEWKLINAGLQRTPGGALGCEDVVLAGFVRDVLPELKAEGWRIEGMETLDALDVTPVEIRFSVRIQSRIRWFSFHIAAEADGVSIPLNEVLRAWRTQKKYLELPQRQGIARIPAELLERSGDLMEVFETLPELENDERRLAPCHIPLVSAVADSAASREIAPAFDLMRAKLEGTLESDRPRLPPTLDKVLRLYQVKGYEWLQTLRQLELGGILADDMGLGKTVQVLALLLAEHTADPSRQSLVVVPTSVLENWAREVDRFVPKLRAVVFHGPQRLELEGLQAADLVITSYALVRRDLDYHLSRHYHYVVLDEAQALKNPDSQTARACRKLVSTHRLALTGTPIENRLLELWSLFAFLMPALLGARQRFRERYITPIERGNSDARITELRRRIGPFILRRLKENVTPELPPLTEDVLYCDLAPDQAALYRTTLEAFRRRIFSLLDLQGLTKTRFTVFEALLKLRQICCHPPLSGLDPKSRVSGSGKLELFTDTLEEILATGHRVLVFSQFVKMLAVIRNTLQQRDIDFQYLDGRTRDRQARVDAFNESDVPVFLISLKAGGIGLNLTGADYVIHYDPWWNPAVEAQATDRAHRIGQTRPVFAYRLIVRGTVEEKILELHARKRSLVDGLIAADKKMGKSLTREDLDFLFPEIR